VGDLAGEGQVDVEVGDSICRRGRGVVPAVASRGSAASPAGVAVDHEDPVFGSV
jgi:hypothetical protein